MPILGTNIEAVFQDNIGIVERMKQKMIIEKVPKCFVACDLLQWESVRRASFLYLHKDIVLY